MLLMFTLPWTFKRYEFVGGKSSKYWQIRHDGNTVEVNYGRIGTAGQWWINDFPDEYEAMDYVLKKTLEKLNKGYREVHT